MSSRNLKFLAAAVLHLSIATKLAFDFKLKNASTAFLLLFFFIVWLPIFFIFLKLKRKWEIKKALQKTDPLLLKKAEGQFYQQDFWNCADTLVVALRPHNLELAAELEDLRDDWIGFFLGDFESPSQAEKAEKRLLKRLTEFLK